MKRPSRHSKWRQIRLSIRRRTGERANKVSRTRELVRLRNVVWVSAPPLFALFHEGARRRVLAFLKALRLAFRSEAPVGIDFLHSRSARSDGMLLFYAELYTLLQNHSTRTKVFVRESRNRKLNGVLKQVGIFRLCGHKCKLSPYGDDVVTWRSATGIEVEGERYDHILGEYDGQLTESLRNGLYDGMAEAMTNCIHHAYIKPRFDRHADTPTEKRWWMFSTERDGLLSIVFCDLGCGIPQTLGARQPSLWARLRAMGREIGDELAIREAIEESRSRTQMAHRGKGLSQLVEAVADSPVGEMLLYSNAGAYWQRGTKIESMAYNASISGTLVSWTVGLGKKNG